MNRLLLTTLAALVILRRTGGGTATLHAEADGLKPAALDIAGSANENMVK